MPRSIQPFHRTVSDAELDDLRQRLARTRWPDQPAGAPWQYGTDLDYLRELLRYWHDDYDWRAAERRLAALPQYSTRLHDIDLHFIHAPGRGPAPMPLLLSHGWPGSIVEFQRLIPLLTDPAAHGGDAADAFTVVAPSLPGYAWSYRPGQPRLGIVQMADCFAALMRDRLGYSRYGAQGGDWGAFITTRLGHAHADALIGIHLNLLAIPSQLVSGHDDPETVAYRHQLRAWAREESAYLRQQGTRPQTLAYGLTDSPAGLAAWIVEKMRAWSDCGGDIESRFDRDQILTNVMLYWLSGAINASFWPYYDRHHNGPLLPEGARIEVPTGYAEFPGENMRAPRAVAERLYDIRRWTRMPAGGHFAAMEEPEALAAEIRAFFRPLRDG